MSQDNGFDFTPTQRKVWDVIRNGQPHLKADVLKALGDDQAEQSTLDIHLTNMRIKLRRKGKDILGQYIARKYHIRVVRLINEDE